jgi:hypothetical protein
MTDPKVEYHFDPPAPSKVVTLAIEARDKMLAEARAEERAAFVARLEEIKNNVEGKYWIITVEVLETLIGEFKPESNQQLGNTEFRRYGDWDVVITTHEAEQEPE